MIGVDLFGNESCVPAAALSAVPVAVQLDLVTAGAERLAIVSGRPVSQERSEIFSPRRGGDEGRAF
jgi:hypothetical protein